MGLLSIFKASLPPLDDYISNLVEYDTRPEKLREFDEATAQIPNRDLVSEARVLLEAGMGDLWSHVSELNTAYGRQVRCRIPQFDSRFSHAEDQLIDFKRSCTVGCVKLGPKVPVHDTAMVYKEYSRMRSILKNGVDEYSEWEPTGRSHELKRRNTPLMQRVRGDEDIFLMWPNVFHTVTGGCVA